jgi:uncharacterized RDD family membrane protein YckC
VSGEPSAAPEAWPPAPSIARRLASMLYEALLLFAIGFAAAWAFFFASGGREATGALRLALQVFLLAVFAAYFLWCWLRGGQTLAMKTWRIRLVAPGKRRVPPAKALLRFAYACVLLGAFFSAVVAAFAHRNPWLAFASLAVAGAGLGWALVDRDRQFLHDRLAGTRLELVSPRVRGNNSNG